MSTPPLIGFRNGALDDSLRHLHIIVPVNRDGAHVADVADNHFCGVEQLRRQLSVSDNDAANAGHGDRPVFFTGKLRGRKP